MTSPLFKGVDPFHRQVAVELLHATNDFFQRSVVPFPVIERGQLPQYDQRRALLSKTACSQKMAGDSIELTVLKLKFSKQGSILVNHI